MSPRKKLNIGECAYCGTIAKLTIDHIPPKNLFDPELPLPTNIIKVPSCEKCHGQNPQVSMDDENFRLMIIMREDTYTLPAVKKVIPKIKRSLANPMKKGMTKALYKSWRKIELRTPSGLFIESKLGYIVDPVRLDNVAARIVKGLFWAEKGYRLPNEYVAIAFSDLGFHGESNAVKQRVEEQIIYPLYSMRPKTIGNNVFSYRFGYYEEDANKSAWLLTFFERVFFLCFTLPAKSIKP